MKLTLTALLNLCFDFVVSSTAAHQVASIRALAVHLTNPAGCAQGPGGGVVVAVVGGLLDEHQVVGRGDPGLPPVQPEPPLPRGLHPGRARVFLTQMVTDFSEGSQLLPAGDEGAGAREAVTLTSHLHAVNNRPAASLVVVEVHHLASVVKSPRNLIGFSLADINEVLSKFVSILDVVPAAAPDPG